MKKREIRILAGGEGKVIDINTFFEHLKTTVAGGDESAVYQGLTYVYRAVELRSNAIREIPWEILRGNRQWKNWPPMLTDLFGTLEADLCIYGRCFTRIVRKQREIWDLQRLNPGAMRIEADKEGIKYFEFVATGKKFSPKEIIFIKYYSPSDDLKTGVSPTTVALEAANLGINSNRFAAAFFANSAVPAMIFEAEGYVDEAMQKETRNKWDSLFGGVVNRFKSAILGQGLKAKVVGAPFKDVAMTELLAEVRKQVSVGFGIPLDLLSQESATYATATTHAKAFWTYTVVPEAKRIEGAFNTQFLYPLGGYLRFDVESTIVMSEDEAKRAEAVHSLVKSGLPLKTALATLGYSIPEGLSIEPTATPIMITGRQPEEYKEDLKLWRKKALRRLDEHDSAFCTFHSLVIPWRVALAVMEGLGDAETPEDVKGVFEEPL